MNMESLNIKKFHMQQTPWKYLEGLHKPLAAELFGTGYRYIERDHNNRAAKPFIWEAIKLDPIRFSYLKTYIVRCLAGIS